MENPSLLEEYNYGKNVLAKAFDAYMKKEPDSGDELWKGLLRYANTYMSRRKFDWAEDRKDVANIAVEKIWKVIDKEPEKIEMITGYFSVICHNAYADYCNGREREEKFISRDSYDKDEELFDRMENRGDMLLAEERYNFYGKGSAETHYLNLLAMQEWDAKHCTKALSKIDKLRRCIEYFLNWNKPTYQMIVIGYCFILHNIEKNKKVKEVTERGAYLEYLKTHTVEWSGEKFLWHLSETKYMDGKTASWGRAYNENLQKLYGETGLKQKDLVFGEYFTTADYDNWLNRGIPALCQLWYKQNLVENEIKTIKKLKEEGLKLKP